MSKTLVTYYSRTGNTQKIAETIYDAVEGEKVLIPVQKLEGTDISSFSLIFIGFPVHSHSIPFAVHDLLKNIPSEKKIALFSTHGTLTGSRLSREALESATVLAAKARVLGTFSCRGKVSPQALDVLMKSPEHKAWTEMAVSASTHPDENDLSEARYFATWILTLAAQD